MFCFVSLVFNDYTELAGRLSLFDWSLNVYVRTVLCSVLSQWFYDHTELASRLSLFDWSLNVHVWTVLCSVLSRWFYVSVHNSHHECVGTNDVNTIPLSVCSFHLTLKCNKVTLYWIALYCVVLYCIVLYCIVVCIVTKT